MSIKKITLDIETVPKDNGDFNIRIVKRDSADPKKVLSVFEQRWSSDTSIMYAAAGLLSLITKYDEDLVYKECGKVCCCDDFVEVDEDCPSCGDVVEWHGPYQRVDIA